MDRHCQEGREGLEHQGGMGYRQGTMERYYQEGPESLEHQGGMGH